LVKGLPDLGQNLRNGKKMAAAAGLTDGLAQLTVDAVESADLERDYIDAEREAESSGGDRTVNVRGLLKRFQHLSLYIEMNLRSDRS